VVAIGLEQLLNTIGVATARALGAPNLRLIAIKLPHALDYLPDDPEYWRGVALGILPEVVAQLEAGPARSSNVA
jgi:hypothetical protein